MKTIFSLIISALVFVACVDEDYFGTSDNANILKIEVSSQSGTSQIFTENDSVYIEVANGADLSNITLRTLEVSPFAKASVEENDVLDFSSGEQTIQITAESGAVSTWVINVEEIGSEPQIENSDFNTWYQNGSYLDIGADDDSSSWGTSNPGVVFGGMQPNVIQEEIAAGDYAVKMITRYSTVGAIVNKPIASGSLFTGDFLQDDINISNPQASIDFGIPFSAEPTSFSIQYQYAPGSKNIDAQQNTLSYPDTADIYVLLERREDGLVKRVATAWYRVGEGNSSLEDLTVDFVYGELHLVQPIICFQNLERLMLQMAKRQPILKWYLHQVLMAIIFKVLKGVRLSSIILN